MRSQEVAFDDARASLHRLGVPADLPTLHGAGVGISRAVLGGSHSVAIYPPLDSLTPIDPSDVLDPADWGAATSLYVHVAFCETRCTFCHYAVEHHPGRNGPATDDDRVGRYLHALRRELTSWGARLARSGTVVTSVYIGGGTPLVLDQTALAGLLRTIRDEFHVVDGAEVCVEGSPLTITAPDGEDKLRFLAADGVTRLSFGVQSFDDTVLRFAARGYRQDRAVQACAVAGRVFENWNIDLIQGLYRGSPEETWHSLVRVGEIRPPHLTWYHGRFADRPQGRWWNGPGQADFEDEYDTLLGRTLIWQELAAAGYHQVDGNRFVRDTRFTDPFKTIRTSASAGLLGVGAASYSHAAAPAPDRDRQGSVFRNEPDVRAYVDTVLDGRSPVRTGRIVDRSEVLATSYATGLRTGRVEDAWLRELRAGHPLLSGHYDELVDRLSAVGVLESCPDAGAPVLRLTELGRLFEDETLSLFFSPAVRDALAERGPRPLLPVATVEAV